MKLLNFKKGNEICLGIKTEKGVVDVKKTAELNSISVPDTIDQVIDGGHKALKQLEELLKKETVILNEEDLAYAPSVISPEKILCVGLNYRTHAIECNLAIPQAPVLFSKFNNALSAHMDIVKLPEGVYKFDYEAELVLIMGKEASNVSREDALSCVFGYTAGNDLSVRDLQFVSGQWLVGKTCDGFAPVGPCILTVDEADPDNLDIKCEVNGVTLQSSNTNDMIFDCSAIISYISKYMTLKPGDIIFTGTPSGVVLGYPEEKQVWLKSGDRTTITIEKIGSLTTTLK
ncbi:MAG: fumarylacetoacetate hydrolase family protein [Clostridiaceae bacterium]